MKVFIAFIVTIFLIGCTADSHDETTYNENMDNNKLANQLDAPPDVFFVHDNNIYKMVRGTYSWTIENENNTSTGIEADSPGPDELIKYQESTIQAKSQDQINIEFDVEPSTYKLVKWKGHGKEEAVLMVDELTFLIPEGIDKLTYVLTGFWDQGNAHYVIEVQIEE